MADDYIKNALDGANKANIKGFRRIRMRHLDVPSALTNKYSPSYLPRRIHEDDGSGSNIRSTRM